MRRDEVLDIVKAAIVHRYPQAAVRAEETDGGWVLEIIDSSFTGDDVGERTRDVFSLLDSSLFPKGIFIWRLCTAPTRADSFTEHASLRTIPRSWDERGMMTITLSAADAYINVTQFDAELLLMAAPAWSAEFDVIEEVGENGSAVLPFKTTSTYVWLEIGGGAYSVRRAKLVGVGVPATVRVAINLGVEPE